MFLFDFLIFIHIYKIMNYIKQNNEIDKIIKMAWSDKISFEQILKETNFSEKSVIKIMRNQLKYKSYIAWRKRVKGRKSKHKKLNKSREHDYCIL